MIIRHNGSSRQYKIYLQNFEDGLYDIAQILTLETDRFCEHGKQRIYARNEAERIMKKECNRNCIIVEVSYCNFGTESQTSNIIYKDGAWV